MKETYDRDRFTRSLTRLCEKLDKKSHAEADLRYPFVMLTVSGRAQARVKSVWAFGSWARGALQCGDLDLAVDIESTWIDGYFLNDRHTAEGSPPEFRAVAPLLLGRQPLVRVLEWSHIQAGRTHIPAEELRLIWKAPEPGATAHDWKAAIAAIEPNPAEGRFVRAHDEFPLRLEQTALTADQAAALVSAAKDGILAWEWRPHGVTADEAPLPLTAKERERAWSIFHESRMRNPATVHRAMVATRDVFKSGHVRYWFGNTCAPWPEVFLDRECDAVVLTPLWSRRGPNGSLVLTPGPNYSLESLTRAAIAFNGESHDSDHFRAKLAKAWGEAQARQSKGRKPKASS